MFKPPWDDLSDDWLDSSEALVSTALDPDEELVWVGRPASRIGIALKEWKMGLFGLFFFIFSLMWSIGVVVGGRNNWDRGKPAPPFARHNVAIALAYAASFLPIGIVMLSAPFRAWRRAAGICYALTDRRAIVCQVDHRGCLILDHLLPPTLGDIELNLRPDGSGDLAFGSRPTMMNGLTRPFGFLHVADVLEVEALVRETLGPLEG